MKGAPGKDAPFNNFIIRGVNDDMVSHPASSRTVAMTTYAVAKAWANAGFSVVPPREDGTKAPTSEWKQFQQEAPSWQQLRGWYETVAGRKGVGLICGKVSGNLEMLELEGRATDGQSLDKIWELCGVLGVQHVWTALCANYMETTPSGGIHFLYRILDEDAAVPGNTKIARRPATKEELAENPLDKIKTLSETRGEGGYVIIAPSHGTVHPSGESWTMISGEPGTVLQVSWDERCRLHQAIHMALDEMPDPVAVEPRPTMRPTMPGEVRPGDDFNDKITWSDLLLPLGWTLVYKRGDKWHWRRPGKTTGISATTSETTGRLWVFSSSTEFEPEKHYSKFEAFTLLEHGGNFSAAASFLAKQGLGSRRDPFASGVLEVPVAYPQSEAANAVAHPSMGDAEVVQQQAGQVDRYGIPMFDSSVFKDLHRWDGHGFVDAYTAMYKDVFRYVGSEKVWMHFDGKMWNRAERGRETLAAQVLTRRMMDYVKSMPEEGDSGETRKALLRKVERMTHDTGVAGLVRSARVRGEIATDWEDFDVKRNLVTLDNGVMDLDTFELHPHNPDHMLTRKINATFDPDAKQGRFTQFMEEVLPDQEVREYLQRVCGYALTGEADSRVLIQLYGPSGSGKSQFTKALFKVMGDFAKRSSDTAFQARPNTYKGPSEDLHSLMGSRFAMMPELDEGFRLNVSLIKALTGGDMMTTRKLYGQEVTWRPEFTVFMITNHLPRVAAGEEAYWNRVKPIKFGQVFVDSMGEALNQEDRNLGEKMAAEEPEVILNWVLEGLKQYRQRGLDAPQQIQQWRDDYRDDVDTVRQFLAEAPGEGRIVKDEKATVMVRQLHLAYAAWCSDNQVPPLGMRKFNERMQAAGFEKHRKELGVTWVGIGLAGFVGEATTPTGGTGWGRGREYWKQMQ